MSLLSAPSEMPLGGLHCLISSFGAQMGIGQGMLENAGAVWEWYRQASKVFK